jgi:demethylmenaquinone methyltransferase / 2-methoxy-6-polyprenyl-1,4-benzoquinol methylase
MSFLLLPSFCQLRTTRRPFWKASRTLATEKTVGSERKHGALELFAGLEDRYDLLSALLSFGQDPRWRRAMVAMVGAGPTERVLDVATGTGMVARELARRYRCSVVGVDQSAEMLAGARRRLARERGLATRIELVQGEAERLGFADAEFDHLTFTYLLRYVDDPAATLAELVRVVRPGGTLASLEFGVPPWAPARAAWRLYTGALLPAGGLLVGGRPWWRAGRFLHRSIPDLYRRHPLPALLDLYRAAGLRDLRARRLSLGGGIVVWGVRAG